MKKQLQYLALGLVVIAMVAGLAGCFENTLLGDKNTGPDSTATVVAGLDPNPPLAVSYPGWYKELQVPWVTQFLAGSTDATQTCGPACIVQIDNYFRGTAPTEAKIWNALDFLNWRFPGRGYYSANSKPTYFTGDNTLGTLISQRYGYAYAALQAPSNDDLSRAFRAINAGFPVIVSVMEDGGQPVNYNSGTYHWVVLVGFNQDHGGEVIVNDPGTHYAYKGNKRHIPISYFLDSWRISGRWWAVVENGSTCIPF